MKLAQEFRAFALKGNVVDLAVAVVIGGAFGKIVTAMVNDLIMPIVSLVMPSNDWKTYALGPFKIGDLAGAIVDFLIIAMVIFLAVVKLTSAFQRKPPEAAPSTKACPECLETIPLAAKRCRACTAVQPV